MKERIKKILKNIIPNIIIQLFRLGKNIFYYEKLMRKIEEKSEMYNYILGTPLHTNLGDHLITLSENDFLNNMYGFNNTIIEIPTEMYQVYRKRLRKSINKKSIIFINGGGWMGNLWPKEDFLIQDMVSTFSFNKIIIFPQTIYFDNSLNNTNEIILSENQSFINCKNLIICLRDQRSYNFARKNYPSVKIMLLPDIALLYASQVSYIRTGIKKPIVNFCLRNDRENSRLKSVENEIVNIVVESGYQIKKISTMSTHRIDEKVRKKVVNEKLKEFATCKLVVTDRLHGMIFSYLSGTPCIVMDNKTKKVFGVYDLWLKNCKYIFKVDKTTDVSEIRLFITSIDSLVIDIFNYEPCFEQLKEVIINGKD